MRAARWHGPGDVRVEDVAVPDRLAPGWVLVEVEACGICGTDMEEYREGPVLIPTSTPHPLTGCCAPLTLGHEGAGRVIAVGPGVEHLRAGQRVGIENSMYCGTCWYCRQGAHQLCPGMASLGLMGDGALAEFMAAPATMCAPVADHVPAAHVALAEPLSVAVRAVRLSGIREGDTIGIVGAGTVGLLLAQVARARGAAQVVVVDRLASRRALARSMGADAAVAPDDAVAAARDLTDGRGFDRSFEAAGNSLAAATAVAALRKGGRATLLGVFPQPLEIDQMDLLMNEKTVGASLSHTFADDYLPAVDLIERGAVVLDPLVTDRISLDDVVTGGFEALARDPEAHLKIVVHPKGVPA